MARLSRSQPDKTGFGKAGSSKGPKNQSSGKSASKKSLPKKPMKVKKPRPETRDLIRWNGKLNYLRFLQSALYQETTLCEYLQLQVCFLVNFL